MAKVLILMGLPGSGKTTFAEQYMNDKNTDWLTVACHINIDHIKEKGYMSDTENIIRKYFKEHIKDNIIDGLFTCNDDIIRVINSIPYKRKSIEIHYWEPDVDTCLYNDIGRRRKSSKNTILNTKMEYPNIEHIKESTGIPNIVVVHHTVVKKPFWKVKSEELGLYLNEGKYFCSDTWSLGGTYGNCWDNDLGYVSPDEQPASFTELDELLENLCPQLTFLKYKELYRQCVIIEQKTENDYYGGSVQYAFYKCNIAKFFELLNEWNLIK